MSKDEFADFRTAIRKILKASPSQVKAAMEEEKKEREKARKAKRASASSPSSSDRDT